MELQLNLMLLAIWVTQMGIMYKLYVLIKLQWAFDKKFEEDKDE